MRLRIAHVISTPSGIGGAERVLAALLAEGTRRGWDQRVFNPFATQDPPDLVELSTPVPVETHLTHRLRDVPAARVWLKDHIERFRPHVVHVHLFHASVLVASLGRVAGEIRLLTHHHGELLAKENRRIESVLDRLAARRMDVVVAVSGAVARFLGAEYGLAPSQLRVIRNGWEGSPLPQRTADEKTTIVSVGNFRPEKAHDVLLEAFDEVRRTLPEVRLLLVGSGQLEAQIRWYAKALGLEELVEFTGHVDDVWPHLSRGDVFALASANEPLGIAAIEAMAAGLPVVATAVGGLPEIVDHGHNGRLVSPGDPHGLAGELIELLRSPDELERLASGARRTAEQFRMEETVAAYCYLYRELAPEAVSG